jgi:hypothetical protein
VSRERVLGTVVKPVIYQVSVLSLVWGDSLAILHGAMGIKAFRGAKISVPG